MIFIKRSVFVAPGNTLFTVMPKDANSLAIVLAHEATAPRMVFETPRFGNGTLTDVETILITLPKPAAFIDGITAVVNKWLVNKCW